MNNDQFKVKIQQPSQQVISIVDNKNNNNNSIKPITQIDNNSPSVSNPNSIIYSNNNISKIQRQFTYSSQPRQTQFQSQSTIFTVSQSDAPVINLPNHAVYSSIQDQKMLICKSQLVSFAQCFAQEKIELENTVGELKGRVSQLEEQVTKLQEQNIRLRQAIEQKQKQFTSPQQTACKMASTPSQQIPTMKLKLKQQFEKRILAQKQFHTQKAICFELNKKIEFLSQKLVYQQQQLSRCQNLLKIKQDIIQNFQWQKTIITTARNNAINNDNSNNKNNSCSLNRINKQQQLESPKISSYNYNNNNKQQEYNEQHSPLMKKSFTNHNKKSMKKSTHGNSSNSINTKQQHANYNNNCNFNNTNQKTQNSSSEINLIHKYQNNFITKQDNNPIVDEDGKNKQSPTKKITKYIINKKPQYNQRHCYENQLNTHYRLNDSKKKLNVSLRKKSLNNSLQNLSMGKNNNNLKNNQTNKQLSRQKTLKPKSIMLKRHTSTHSQLQNNTQFIQIQKQKEFKAYYMRIITELQKQNQRLKNQITRLTQQSTSRFNIPSLSQSQSLIKSTNIITNQTKYQTPQQQRKYLLLKQKCSLLQSQLQKTVTKYLSLQQKNQQLEKLVLSLQNQLKNYSNNQKRYYEGQKQYEFNQQQQPLSRPSLGLSDLVTPQFRQSKWNNNFFAKTKDENHTQKLFQNISLHEKGYEKKNTFLDTFEKQKSPHQSCLIDNKTSNNSLFNIDEKAASNVFKGSIQDVSEIICRNDQQEVMEETF